MRLEYRLLDASQEYPLLYYYNDISQREVELRMACSRFVKMGTAYEKTSAAQEVMCYVIYLRPAQALQKEKWPKVPEQDVYLEMRHWPTAKIGAELIERAKVVGDSELLLHLLCDYMQFLGEEWLVQAVELDEDRGCYIRYVEAVDEEEKDAAE